MKFSVILIIAVIAFSNICRADQKFFLSQVTSEGARSNIGPDPINIKWTYGQGEITSMGLRQHYLVGYDLKANYGTELKLNDIYSPWQVNVRSTNHNFTLMGAQAGLEAIYAPDVRPDLSIQQATIAKPPGDNSIIDAEIKALGNKIMPKNFQTIPIHAMDFDKDTILMGDWCPKISTLNQKSVSDPTFQTNLLNKYATAVKGFKDYVKLDNLTIHEIFSYMDAIYAHNFNLDSLDTLKNFYPDLMKFRIDYYNQLWSNADSLKLFTNGFVTDLNRYLVSAVQQYENTGLDNYNKMKLSLYYGTLETAYVISRAFGYNHTDGPQFSSQFLIELNNSTSGYTVTALYNKQVIALGGDCKGATACPLTSFYSLLQSMKATDALIQTCKTSSVDGNKLYEQENANNKVDNKLVISMVLLILFTIASLSLFLYHILKRTKPARRHRSLKVNDEEALLVE